MNEDQHNATRMIKGRGAVSNREGRFQARASVPLSDGWDLDGCDDPAPATELLPDASRSIIARNKSPDIPFDRSINPYKGCEHGCVYCYARQTHSYLDLSPGIDFETKIFYKTDVDALLRKEIERPGYRCEPIALGTNTDPYQPAEKKLRITRRILEILLEYRHPITIVTKGALLGRDLDLLAGFAEHDLVRVMISITTLDNGLKTRLEPRAAAPAKRLQLVRQLSASGIPVGVMIAPLIPMLNDHELEEIVAASVAAGARSFGYVMIRLPHEVKDLFKEWLAAHEPLKSQRIIARIHDLHDGRDYDAAFGRRQTGTGEFATLIRKRFDLALRKHGIVPRTEPPLRTDLFAVPGRAVQLGLFE
jgi:DNA repair photolyase